MNRILSIISIIAALVIMPFSGSAKAFTLVVDAGHGGRDVGCEGEYSKEKNITLPVAKMFGKMVKDTYGSDVRVIYTRLSDTGYPLRERADIANRNHGDLFVSIHINSIAKGSAGRRTVNGVSVYAANYNNTEENFDTITSMIRLTELDKNGNKTSAPYRRGSDESRIAYELVQYDRMLKGIDFAGTAQRKLISVAGRKDMNTRQSDFQVLWSTCMPAVLVELDYICNPDVEKFLASKEGQEKCAQALFDAFVVYYNKYKD